MNLQLKWTNFNVGSVTVKIYRGDAPIDRANLTGLIATLSAGETSYVDTTAVRGATYYYVFETISASDRVVSNNYTVVAAPRRGPGPVRLQLGDYSLGYFGALASSVFTTVADLRNALGFAGGTSVLLNSPTWHKFARNGKVLIIPDGPVVNGVSWNMLYLAGLVFGTNDNGPYNGGNVNTNQYKTVTIGPDTFIVRLMRGYTDDLSQRPPATTVPEPLESFVCEYDDIVYPLSGYVPDRQRMVNLVSGTSQSMRYNQASALPVVQELTAAQGAVTRGLNAVSRAGIANRASLAVSLATCGWYPVLELIEPAPGV